MGWNDSWPAMGNTQNDGTLLAVVNLMADFESGTLISYLHLTVTIAL